MDVPRIGTLGESCHQNVIFNYRSEKRTLCTETIPGRKNRYIQTSGPPPPPQIPLSPIGEKIQGLRVIRNRSNSLRLGRLALYRHLEKVETMRCFWELKHVELEGGGQQVQCILLLLLS